MTALKEMPQTTASPEYEQLDNVPNLNTELVARFTPESLHISDAGGFDPSQAIKVLRSSEGQTCIGIDIGGDKAAIAEYRIHDGGLELLALTQTNKTDNTAAGHGTGYLSAIEGAAYRTYKKDDSVPTGISFAGPIKDGKPLEGPNVGVLMQELSEAYGGDFRGRSGEEDILFGDHLKATANDAVAGLYAGAVEAVRQYPDVKNVIYLINGSGLGAAVLKDGQLIGCEPGHVEAVAALNPYNQQEACGMFGNQYTCVENTVSGKAGIEATFAKQTGQNVDGREIAALARQGNELALNLYDNSAQNVAGTIQGIANALELSLTDGSTAVVCHGGVFNVDDYAAHVQQMLEKAGSMAPMLLTRDFSDNACLEGAAIAGLVASRKS